MKRRKLWKTGEDGLCLSSSAIQTRPGPLSLLEEWSVTPHCFVVFFVLLATPKLGQIAMVYRYRTIVIVVVVVVIVIIIIVTIII